MEEYFANNPEEQRGHEQDEDADDVQIVSQSTGTSTIATASMIVTPASSAPSRKGSKGTKRSGRKYSTRREQHRELKIGKEKDDRERLTKLLLSLKLSRTNSASNISNILLNELN